MAARSAPEEAVLVLDRLGFVALVLFEVDDPGGVGVLGDSFQGRAFAEEWDDVVVDVGVVFAAAVVLNAGEPIDVAAQPVDEQHDFRAGIAFGPEDLERLVDTDLVDEVGPPLSVAVVVEGFRRLPTLAVGVVVVERDLPADRAVLAWTWCGHCVASRVVDVSTCRLRSAKW
ncbi:hypothetical protein [Nocardia xishanensis]|uniref:hypothetical protein n=1 Tax=Nocardia xishanensis TaxID=238964 RepID=UPI0012F4BFDB|nr:hypothetical protein [Nocardia xishanensis]